MIFPVSYVSVLLVAIVSMLLGALWAPLIRATGKWRFELFGIDFGLGVVFSAVLVGFTLGSMGEEITFYDNINIMRKSSLMFLLGFGAVLNLGMILLIGAVSLSGMATAFLVGMGMATAVSAIGMHIFQPIMGTVYLAVGSLLLLAGIGLAASAYAARVRQRDTELLQKAVAAGMKGKVPQGSPAKGPVLAAVGGLLIGLVQPVAIWAQLRDEIGFGAYSMTSLFAVSFLAATPFFSLFFLNLPVQGEALSFGAWLRGKAKPRLMGMASGAVWYCGLVALLLAVTATPAAGVSKGLAFSVSHMSVVLGAFLGIFVYGEFTGFPRARGRALMALGAAGAGILVFLISKV